MGPNGTSLSMNSTILSARTLRRVGGLVCAAVAEQIRGDERVALGAEVVGLIVPVEHARGKTMQPEERDPVSAWDR